VKYLSLVSMYTSQHLKTYFITVVAVIIVFNLPLEYFFGISQEFKEQILANITGGLVVGIIIFLYSNSRDTILNKKLVKNRFDTLVYPELVSAMNRTLEGGLKEATYVGNGTSIINLFKFYDKFKIDLTVYLEEFSLLAVKESWHCFYSLVKSSYIIEEDLNELLKSKIVDISMKNSISPSSYTYEIWLYLKWKILFPNLQLSDFTRKNPTIMLIDSRLLPLYELLLTEADILKIQSQILDLKNRLLNEVHLITKLNNYSIKEI
jgi:hypothetical protein